jgi:hypothetical protein
MARHADGDWRDVGRTRGAAGGNLIMAKGSGKKSSKRSRAAKAAAAITARERVARLEKALAAGLRREAKAASQLERAQLEVAVLRMALAELIAEADGAPPPAVVAEVTELPAQSVPPTEQKPVARPRASRPRAAAKPATAAAKPAVRAKPATAAKPAVRAKPATAAKPATTTKPTAAKPATPRRSTRPGPGTSAPDR